MLAVTKPVETALKKRCDAWHLRLDKMSFDRNGGPEAKTRALQAVCATYANQRAVLQGTAQARLRWLDALKRRHGDRFGEVTLALESRLLLHLGRASVLENVGLYCDRTTGLPLIPGTALKGVLSTWACWEGNQKPDGSFNEGNHFVTDRQELGRRILGDDSPNGSEHAGDVIFVGGFPTTPPTLGFDIVNPHYDAEGTDKTRLTPNTLLCVEPGTLWRFVFFARSGPADAANLLATTKRWIEEALTQMGIGAKIAAGYGRFRQPAPQDLAAQAEAINAAKAAEANSRQQAEKAAQQARQREAAQAALACDYPQQATFKNRVLARLNPGQLEQLKSEIAILQKPENGLWLEQLKQALASKEYKDVRKRLRDKDWFPKDWLPPQ
jgi:CRISPR-associated protein Cmr6